MNLSIILEFPWFRRWEIEATFYVDLKQWCWFSQYHTDGNLKDCSICKDLGVDPGSAKFFELDVSILCFTFILEGLQHES